MMDEQTKVLIAVSPEAPEWMRRVAETMAEGYEGAHGAILTICYDGSQTQMAQTVNADDCVSAIANLAETLREKFGKKMAEALIELAIREETEADA